MIMIVSLLKTEHVVCMFMCLIHVYVHILGTNLEPGTVKRARPDSFETIFDGLKTGSDHFVTFYV